ncbi:hypothetical protein AURDEDRAFT_171046 [Auricularia subglabra TFB-10046 SS5]|nr:hypothetical protein AURDEDRAFT_171046 [Auricularia subglabra TFB-10046 SS5]
MSNVIHASHLRPYQLSPVEFGECAQIPVPCWNTNTAEEYTVEKLVAHRQNRSKKQLEYLLRNAPAHLLDYRQVHNL